MIVFAVMMDYSIKQLRFGCKEMYEARNVNMSQREADEWVERNKPTPICDCRQDRDACTCKGGE